MAAKTISAEKNRGSVWGRLRRNYQKHRGLYWIAVPIVLYFAIFKYLPMFGIVIAFQDYSPGKGFLGSEFVGLDNFVEFLTNPSASRTILNTLRLNFFSLLVEFPAPIILALLLNEVKCGPFKKTVQTFSYMPHFISLVVVCGILTDFSSSIGVFNDIAELLGGKKNLSKGVHITVEEESVRVDVSILIKYGYTIIDVAKEVQNAVFSAIENTSGLTVECVNVHVLGVTFDREAKKPQ